MKAGLYVVGTPIGNLGDISARAVNTLREADAILTEDTRRTRILLDHFGIRALTLSCHKFNEASRTAEAVDRIRQGAAWALVTDSGMPAVSDPGSRMIAACRQSGIPVTVIPGPSAVTAAVALAGFSGGGFLFEGFLPRKSGARARRVSEWAQSAVPVVVFESPHRLKALLAEIAAALPGRCVFVGRELTKKFEECLWGTAQEILETIGERAIKGEIVLVVDSAG